MWNYTLIFITFIKCSFFTQSYVIIHQSGFPEIQLTYQNGIVSMKYYDKNIYKESDGNIISLSKDSFGFRIRFYHKFLYVDPSSKEFIGKDIKTDDFNFYFNIVPLKNGVKIMKNDKCLEKIGWNEARNGFYVALMPCVNNRNQIFTIRPVLCEKEKTVSQKIKINLNIINDE